MTLPLTPDMLERAYEYLRSTPPFWKWKLPPGEEIEFRVIARRDREGAHTTYRRLNEHVIDVSIYKIAYTGSLMTVMAHEMIHACQAVRKTFTPHAEHNAEFRRLSKIVCRYHGFDPKAFI